MKKVLVLLLVLSVACSSVFAFTGIGNLFSKDSKESLEESVEVVEEQPVQEAVSVEMPETSSLTAPKKTSNGVSTALTGLEEKKTLNKKELAEHKANLEAVASDVDMLIADIEAIHPFAQAGFQLGFNNSCPVVGVVVGGGAKFGTSGIMALGNVGYDIVEIQEGCKWDFKPSWDKFSATVMIGYEF